MRPSYREFMYALYVKNAYQLSLEIPFLPKFFDAHICHMSMRPSKFLKRGCALFIFTNNDHYMYSDMSLEGMKKFSYVWVSGNENLKLCKL
jgi:hypothetical protein